MNYLDELSDLDGSIGKLTRQGQEVGWIAIVRESFRGLLGRRQWRAWILISWSGGTRERIEEDYPPFVTVPELRQGVYFHPKLGLFSIEWLDGYVKAEAWKDHGITESIEAYL